MIREMMNFDVVMRPAPGLDIEHGLQKLNDLLSWDDVEPVSETNRPGFYVTEDCENVIYAMMEYSGTSREEACKDWVDCLRYGAVSPLVHVTSGELSVAGGGGFWRRGYVAGRSRATACTMAVRSRSATRTWLTPDGTSFGRVEESPLRRLTDVRCKRMI